MKEAALDVRLAAISGVLIAAAFLLMLPKEWAVSRARRMRDQEPPWRSSPSR